MLRAEEDVEMSGWGPIAYPAVRMNGIDDIESTR